MKAFHEKVACMLCTGIIVVFVLGFQMNYYQEDVSYCNDRANVVLAGTLTLPQKVGLFPAVILVAGYGASDRDVTQGKHKYFRVLAEYLTQRGIAVLRYDKRGAGQSTGVYETATTRDFANDVRAGIEYLKTRMEIDLSKIGVVGLSEGGLIAAMLAAECPDIAFAVLMAPAVASDMESCLDQVALQLFADGASQEFIDYDRQMREKIYQVVVHESDIIKAEQKLQAIVSEYLATLTEAQKEEAEKLPFALTAEKADLIIKVYNSPWYRYFWSYNVASSLQRIAIPVLCVNGDRDWIASPMKVFSVLENNFIQAGNTNYLLVELPNLNHCFQTCKTGAIAEYGTIEETMAPIALQTIGDWIKVQV